MKISQRLLVSFALLIADSTWLYVAIAAFGIVAVRDSAPLSWPWVMLVMSVGMVTAALPQASWWRAVQGMAGMSTVYFAVAFLAYQGGFEPLWILRLLDGGYAIQSTFSLVIAIVAAAIVWRQGTLLAVDPFLADRAVRRFRIGVAVFALALLLEVGGAGALGTAALLVPFFSASLSAMALARLPSVTAAGRGWVLIVSSSVVLVILLGMASGLLAGVVGRGGAGLLADGWSRIAGYLGEAVKFVVLPILELVFVFLNWFFALLVGTENTAGWSMPELLGPPPGDGLKSWDWPFDLLPLALALLIVIFLYRVLKPVLRRIRKTASEPGEAHHESIRADARPLTDLARLLRLLFGLTKADAGGARAWRCPSAEPGITEAFQLYFSLLQTAVGRGHELQPSATPLERVPSLRATLPGVPVERITRCFNAACYGRFPAEVETVRDLRQMLEKDVRSSTVTTQN